LFDYNEQGEKLFLKMNSASVGSLLPLEAPRRGLGTLNNNFNILIAYLTEASSLVAKNAHSENSYCEGLMVSSLCMIFQKIL
jgi:hypothetical protein